MTWTCVECTTVYSVGAPRCPQCGSTEYVETHMAKITRHGGASNRDADPPADPVGEAPQSAPAPDPAPEPKPAPRRRTRTQTRKEE